MSELKLLVQMQALTVFRKAIYGRILRKFGRSKRMNCCLYWRETPAKLWYISMVSRLKERHVAIEERLIVLCHTHRGDTPLGFFVVASKSGHANGANKNTKNYSFNTKTLH